MNNTFSRVNSVQSKISEILDIIKGFKDVLDKAVGHLPGLVHLNLDKDDVPTVMPVRDISQALRGKLNSKVDVLVDNDVLAVVAKPTPWENCPVVAKKNQEIYEFALTP